MELATLQGMEPRVGPVESQAFPLRRLCRVEEASFKAVADEGVRPAKLVDQRDVVVDLVEL